MCVSRGRGEHGWVRETKLIAPIIHEEMDAHRAEAQRTRYQRLSDARALDL